jgi:hypothetical protein
MRQLQHLELGYYRVTSGWAGNAVEMPGADQLGAAFGALEQLQTLTLHRAWGVDALLAHLHRAPALRILFIHCEPDCYTTEIAYSPVPSRDVLGALLTAAPRLEVRLLMAASLDHRRAVNQAAGRDHDHAAFEQLWGKWMCLVAELDRVTTDSEEPLVA